MRGRIISISDVGEDDLRAWQELADHAVEPNPLFEPACLLPAAHHLPNGRDLRLVVAEEDGKFMGCFPVVRRASRTRPSATWPGLWRPTFSTHVRRNRYDGTPLVRAERGEDAFVALFTTLAGHPGKERAGVLVLEAMAFGGATSSYLMSAAERLRFPLHVAHSYERPIVRRRQEMSYRDIHRQKARRDWSRRERQLGEKLGGPVELVDRSSDPEAVEILLAMEAAGYKGRVEGRRSDRFRTIEGARGGAFMCWPGEPEWLEEMCDRLRSDSRLLLYCLQVGSTVVAMQLMLRGGAGCFEIVTIFDEAYTRYAPGLLLQLKSIDRFHQETNAEWLDSCTYEGNETLLRIYPDRRRVATLLLGLGGFVDRTSLAIGVPAWQFARQRLGPGSSIRDNERARRLLDWVTTKAFR